MQAATLATTWKDEYVTVTVVSIINFIVVGGIAHGFGYPQMLEGLIVGLRVLVELGIDIGFLMTATVLAGLGLSVWRRI